MDTILSTFLRTVLYLFPAALICLFPIRNRLRFSKKIVCTGAIILNLIFAVLVTYISVTFGIAENVVIFIGLLPMLLCYIYCCKVYPPILIFIFATAMLAMAFVSGCADGVYFEFFANSEINNLIYVGVLFGFVILFLIPMFYFFMKRIAKVVYEYKDRKVWRVLWIIPLTLTVIIVIFPIYTALEYFSASIILSIGSIFVYYAIFIMMEQSVLASRLQEENAAKEKQLIIEQSQYNALFSGIEQTRIARHDLRHHFNAILSYSKSNQPQKLQAYIEQYLSNQQEEKLTVFCENPVINMLLSYYQALAKEHDIKTDFGVTMYGNVTVAEPDLWVLFGNCLENAIEACCRYEGRDKHIKLTAKQKGEMLGITIDNSYRGDIIKGEHNVFVSSKTASRAGVGLRSVQTVVEKYHGMLQINYDSTLFCVSIMLCLSE